MSDRTLRHKVAIVGVGETQYFKHGQSPDPEFKLALKAIPAACASAGISPHEIDGFASYSDDRNDAVRLATALGIPELRHSSMQWGGGGGGSCRSCRRGDCRRACGLHRRISCAGPRAVRTVRAGWNGVRLRQCGPRDYRRDGFPGPARRDIAGPTLCHEGATFHGRARGRAGGALGGC